jgi:FkbM family methyltransferase
MNFSLEYFKYLRYTKSQEWSNFLFEKNIPIFDFNVSKKDNKVFIRSVNHFFSPEDFPVFFEGYSKYCWKFIDAGLLFVFEGKNMFVKINELTIKIETLEELFIINEVFLENMYRVESKAEYVVLDIGMNVGITSLYFSQFDNIKKIYAFEPLKPTFTCANANLILNKKYSPKVQAFNFGLSNKAQNIEVSFDPINKGNVGIKNAGITALSQKNVELIELREASKVLRQISEENPSTRFLVKLDCEGSEYDIFENLFSASMLPLFKIFIIEWHNMVGYKERLHNLINAFKECNFQVLTVGSLYNGTGMIYCFNDN